MKRFAVSAAQGQRAYRLGVKPLPANGKFRLLRVKLGVLRWQNGSRRSILAIPLLALGKAELEAVRSWQLPRRAGHRNTHFLIGSPNVPVHLRGFEIRGTDRVETGVLRVRIAPPPLPAVLEPGREGDRPGGKIEQIAVEMEIGQWQLKLAGGMQSNVNPADCCLGVSTLVSKEGIKRCGRVRIQQRFA